MEARRHREAGRGGKPMIEVALWLLLAVVMYFAGRYDVVKEIEAATWDLVYTDAHGIRLNRRAPSRED